MKMKWNEIIIMKMNNVKNEIMKWIIIIIIIIIIMK